MAPRRVPGSGIGRGSAAPTVIAPQLPKTNLSSPSPRARTRKSFDFTPTMPKQWRHVLIVALAIGVAAVGFDSKNLPLPPASESNELASSTRLGTARASEQVTSLLPTVKSIQLPPIPIKKAGVKEPVGLADGIVLIDEATMLPLYEKGANTKRSVASTTKILTAMVAAQKYKDLDRPVPVSQTAINQIGSAVGYRPGETVTVRQLLYGLMIVSGNDAAKQLSELYLPEGGDVSTAAFVADMNRLAAQLGMSNSHFYDPAGLNDEGYSTPVDMAKALNHMLKNPMLTQIVKTANYEYRSSEGYLHTLKNSNRLVTEEMRYDGIIGGKTGFTPETPEGGAGHCMIVAAERNGRRLIVSVLGTHSNTAPASAEVARAMFEYGFNNFTWTPIAR